MKKTPCAKSTGLPYAGFPKGRSPLAARRVKCPAVRNYFTSVSRIYQQTFIGTHNNLAFVKLYNSKNALEVVGVFNYRVMPWYDEQDVRLLRILMDKATEYCGNRDRHGFRFYLTIEDIDHSKTKAKSPQTNSICERFHKTIQIEFFGVAFMKKIYLSLDEIQEDTDKWIEEYNTERAHSGKYSLNKTPWQTFLNSKNLADNKLLDRLQPTDNAVIEISSVDDVLATTKVGLL